MSEDFDKADVCGVEPVEGAMLTYFEYNCRRFAKQVAKLNEAIQQAAAKGELHVMVLLAQFGGDMRNDLLENQFRVFLGNYLQWLGYSTNWSERNAVWSRREVNGFYHEWNGQGSNSEHGTMTNSGELLKRIDCHLFETSEENTIQQIWQLQTLKISWETTDFSEPKEGHKNALIRKVYVMNQPRPTQWQMRE